MQHIRASNTNSLKFLCLVLAIVSFWIYANTLLNGYVLDDGMVLSENVLVKNGIKAIPGILSAVRTEGVEMNAGNEFYRPLSMVMFAIEVQFCGTNPAVGHFFNVLAFIGCVLMLFLFIDKLLEGNKRAVAFIAAFIFAIHPIHTEVVANIKSRDELLCYFFGFWSLNLLMSYMAKGRAGYFIAGILTLLLAYLSKETVIAFVVIVPLVFFFYRNENRRRAVFITGGALLATLVFLGLRQIILSQYGPNGDSGGLSFIENALVNVPDASTRFATELLVLGKYLKLMLLPYPLLCNYSFNSIPFVGFGDFGVLSSMVIYVSLIVFSIYRLFKKKKDMWTFAILFYLCTLFLFSNILFLIGAQMAERFVFFASTGFCIAVALAVEQWLLKQVATDINSLKMPKVLVLLCVLLVVYGGLAIARNRDWKSNYTLYSGDIKKSHDDSRLYFWLAADIAQNMYGKEPDTIKQKELDRQSIRYLQQAISIYPDFADVHAELGWIYERNRKHDSAYYYNTKALVINPNNSAANNNLGSMYYAAGKYPQGVEALNKAVAGNPKFKLAYMTRANCYTQMKRYDAAIADCNKILEMDPEYVDAHQALGNAYMRKQDYEQAEEHFKTVLTRKPEYVAALNNLGVIYLNTKRFEQAIEQFRKVIALDLGYANAYSNLSRAYFFTKQYEAAIQTINKEMQVGSQNMMDIPILALCYQKTGNIEMAVKYEAIAKQAYPEFKLQ